MGKNGFQYTKQHRKLTSYREHKFYLYRLHGTNTTNIAWNRLKLSTCVQLVALILNALLCFSFWHTLECLCFCCQPKQVRNR